jgi:hypothetical protein
MPSTSNWIDLIPVCTDVYVYQADLICDDCGDVIIRKLEKQGVENTGESDDFPQKSYYTGGGEADSPNHCGMGEECQNRIHVPGGATIGCPLGNPLTSDGIKWLFERLAENIVSKDIHHRLVGRLWAHIYSDYLRNCPLALLQIENITFSFAPSLVKILNSLKGKEKAGIMPEAFTDCSYIYGGASSPEKTILWRVEATNDGKFANPETVYLPPSEVHERTLQDMIEEAISEGAWD